jgi:hypothetical protein
MMRLSEAIREGAKKRPVQHFGHFYNTINQGTCALGAAYEGCTGRTISHKIRHNVIMDSIAECTGASCYSPVTNIAVPDVVDRSCSSLREVIVELNDTHQWTREEIADWLESQNL